MLTHLLHSANKPINTGSCDFASVLVHVASVGRSAASVQEHLPTVAATEMSVAESTVAPTRLRCSLS